MHAAPPSMLGEADSGREMLRVAPPLTCLPLSPASSQFISSFIPFLVPSSLLSPFSSLPIFRLSSSSLHLLFSLPSSPFSSCPPFFSLLSLSFPFFLFPLSDPVLHFWSFLSLPNSSFPFLYFPLPCCFPLTSFLPASLLLYSFFIYLPRPCCSPLTSFLPASLFNSLTSSSLLLSSLLSCLPLSFFIPLSSSFI